MKEKTASHGGLWTVVVLSLFLTALVGSTVLLGMHQSAQRSAQGEEPAVSPNPTAFPGVMINGTLYAPDTISVSETGKGMTVSELRAALSLLPDLERVELSEPDLTPEEQVALKRVFPSVEFLWPVDVFGHRVMSDVRSLSLAGRTDLTADSLRILRERAELLYALESVDLTGCGLADRDLHSLDTALPDTDVIWTMRAYGREICSTDTLVDLRGITVKDKGAQIEALLAYLPHLEKVDMCGCGLSNEEMDALNRRHEGVRFIWMVNILTATIRTDSDFFIPYRSSGVKQTGINAGYKSLKYCPDLIALDVGHSHSHDFSYLDVMPHLKYFIMVECYPTDMRPVGRLQELEWLEMFQCITKDISPLVNCTSLRDLNVCYVVCPRDNMFDTLRQMTWLRRLWCSGTSMTKAQIAALREALPNTEIWCKWGDESTGGTWRFDEDYYDMRDAFHMYYMDITGNKVRRKTPEELQAIHDKFWK